MELQGSCHCQSVRFNCKTHSPYPYMRCYCSICRKTAGGGGYAINIMAVADSLKIEGEEFISIYQARLTPSKKSNSEVSSGQRHFCKHCGSFLWLFDPHWPELIHPFASAIDTPLPKPPETIHMMLAYAANWCEIPQGKQEIHYKQYPPLSIEEWHKQHNLWVEG
ncbi:GFA family protein [Legionella brunensis]|uniref:Glutathione-dependent formaldehyde-activating enzyme n=1 Tax=Legionella brunensis TaxID=29422 RepID=A0A0W0S3I0_9GAMM|nr:GFA family protein [Legionella brunensis]KTC77998.1 Glutathione-dependent formaldehyde-activating enzyme [Legionella brunensis]